MEKLIYPVWKSADRDADVFRDELIHDLAGQWLALADVRGLRIAVVDSAVAAAAGKRLASTGPLPDGLVSVWVNTAGARQVLERLLATHVERFSCYLVCEAEPLIDTGGAASPGSRSRGFCQVALLRRPARLTETEWLAVWQGSHTQIAIDTQSTFGYRQNVVVRPLGGESAGLDAIVEENFPAEAMSSDLEFYAAENDQTLQRHAGAMMESCARFIDFDQIDVIPMSEYCMK